MQMQTGALVAQLDRASDYGSEGCEFEPRRVRHKKSLPCGGFFYGLCTNEVRTHNIIKSLSSVRSETQDGERAKRESHPRRRLVRNLPCGGFFYGLCTGR